MVQDNRDVIVFFDGLLNWIEVDTETFVAYVITIFIAIGMLCVVNSCLCVVLQTYCGLRKTCMCFPFCCCYMIVRHQKDKKERNKYHQIGGHILEDFEKDSDRIINDPLTATKSLDVDLGVDVEE